MNTPESIRARADQLRELADSNQIDAAEEDARGNVILARGLRERAADYLRLAGELLAKLAEPASMMFVFGVLYVIWSATP